MPGLICVDEQYNIVNLTFLKILLANLLVTWCIKVFVAVEY